jgi:hypothetical protein
MEKAAELLALQAAETMSRDYNHNIFNVSLQFDSKHFSKPNSLPAMFADKDKHFDLQPGLLPNLAEMQFPAYPNYQAYDGRVIDVPIPAKAMVFLDCIEAFCRRWQIEIPARPTEQSIATAALREGILTADKDAIGGLLDQVSHNNLSVLEQILKDAEGGKLELGGEAIQAGGKNPAGKAIAKMKRLDVLQQLHSSGELTGDWRRSAVAKRIAQLEV